MGYTAARYRGLVRNALDFALAAVALFFGSTLIAVQSVTDAPAGRVLAATAAGFLLWAALLGLFVNDYDNPLGPGIFIFDLGIELLKSCAHPRLTCAH